MPTAVHMRPHALGLTLGGARTSSPRTFIRRAVHRQLTFQRSPGPRTKTLRHTLPTARTPTPQEHKIHKPDSRLGGLGGERGAEGSKGRPEPLRQRPGELFCTEAGGGGGVDRRREAAQPPSLSPCFWASDPQHEFQTQAGCSCLRSSRQPQADTWRCFLKNKVKRYPGFLHPE